MATRKTTASKTKQKSKPGAVGTFTVPGVPMADAHKLAKQLQTCLDQLNDLHLTLKHAHWNVIGPKFIGVHEMLDPQVDAVREMVDVIAERMATMGVAPIGTPGYIVANRDWEDYPLGLAQAAEHLGALDVVYDRVIANHREALEAAGDIDPITEDILISQTGQMELFQWFIRAHLKDDYGALATNGASTEKQAAKQALAADKNVD